MGNITSSELSDNTTHNNENMSDITNTQETQISSNLTQDSSNMSEDTSSATETQTQQPEETIQHDAISACNQKPTENENNTSESCNLNSTTEESPTSSNKTQEHIPSKSDQTMNVLRNTHHSTHDRHPKQTSNNSDSASLNIASRCSIMLQQSSNEPNATEVTTEYFKLDLEKRHEKRRQLIAEKRKEMMTLREELEKYKTENEELKQGNYPDDYEIYKRENEELKRKLAEVMKNQSSVANNEHVDTTLVAQENKQNIKIPIELDQCKREIEKLKTELCNKTEILRQLNKSKHESEQTNLQLHTITQANLDLETRLSEVTDQLVNVKKENGILAKEMRSREQLVTEISDLKKENKELKAEAESLKQEYRRGEELAEKNNELRISLAQMQSELQDLNTEFANIEQERSEYAKHVGALKDVVRVTKEMLSIRESQIEELKGKVKTVEEILASKEMKIMSDGLREEYEKQLRNIRNLRNLYEERQRLDKRDKENLQEQLDECKKQVEDEQKKNSELQERVIELEKDNSLKYDTITSLQSNLGLSKAESKELQAEINIINQLFSETLLGFKNTQEIDLEKLVKMLEENHDLLTNMATNEESNSTSAALPKLLLDLINQMNKEDEAVCNENTENVCQASNQLNSAEEIVETLPKVWKVLMELLSHQNPPLNALFGACQEEPCYKLIETSKGAKLKLSVSQTFIRLKDLILEKKFLERETYRLKHLNTHLEGRLQDQEKRLELVSSEVKNTWNVVDKMQRQHQQLHTHEKVLRHELKEKRKLLNELKEDLQYCREKWVEARAKNDTTHSQWKELRKEFADRKNKGGDDFNQSAESGYSDGKDSSEDERGYESDVSEGKHETDVENEFGEQKTESDKNDEKRQLVQNECSNVSCFNEQIRELEDVTVDIVLGGEVEMSAENNNPREEQIEQIESVIGDTNANLPQEPVSNEEDSNITLDSEIQELFDEMCKFVERGTESGNNNSSNVEATEEELNARKERLQRLEEEFKEVTEFDIKEITKDNIDNTNENKADIEIKSETINKTENTIVNHTSDIQININKESIVNNTTGESSNAANNQSSNFIQIEDTQISTNTELTTEVINETAVLQQSPVMQSTEEILKRREERLKRLELQSQLLLTKTRNTTQKSNVICEKLDVLHGIYGEPCNEEIATNANSQDTPKCSRKHREETLIRREARLRKLEIQCKELLARVLQKTEIKNQNSKEAREKGNVNLNTKTSETQTSTSSNNSEEASQIIRSKETPENEIKTIKQSDILSDDDNIIADDANKTDNKSKCCSMIDSNKEYSASVSQFLLTDYDLKLNEENLVRIENRSRNLLSRIKHHSLDLNDEFVEEITCMLQELIQIIAAEISSVTTLYEHCTNSTSDESQMLDEASSVIDPEMYFDTREARFLAVGETFDAIVKAIMQS